MATMKRWKFVDPTLDPTDDDYEWVFPTNPNKMSSPFHERKLTMSPTTSPAGQMLTWEAPFEPRSWSFGGVIIQGAEMYESLRHWVYDKSGHVWVYDHFGRKLDTVLQSFDPEGPGMAKRITYWYHTYTISGYVYSVGAPATSEVPA